MPSATSGTDEQDAPAAVKSNQMPRPEPMCAHTARAVFLPATGAKRDFLRVFAQVSDYFAKSVDFTAARCYHMAQEKTKITSNGC